MRQIKLILIVWSFFCTSSIFGQSNSYPPIGDVTIRNYSPLINLQRLENVGGFIAGIQTKLLDGTNSWYFGNLQSDTWVVSKGDYTNPKLAILNSGNVGIGTTVPAAKLTINADANSNTNSILIYSNNVVADSYTAIGSYFANGNGNVNSQVRFGNEEVANSKSYLAFATGTAGTALERIRINSIGNVGIGITNPQNKLDVNGTIHSKEVKVDMNGWSDFVFKKDYTLPTLQEVEKHIAEKGHLENIPSEEEVLKNGINLGEMNSKLLQKIEEMTLYMIEMQKEIERQNKKIEFLQTKL